MNESQAHRGPDGHGIHLEPGLGLGHRRLSIIDLDAGKQPLYNEDQSVVVVYNGEIYNFGPLAKELEGLGHRFRTRCDTEVIVHAWEQWGTECLHRFRGMFAFALWDRNQQVLFVARDRLGIKPLFYAVDTDGTFLFSSELKALLLSARVPRKLDHSAIEEYFAFGYVPDPKTILESVFKLAPGHFMCIRKGDENPIQTEYWDVRFDKVRQESTKNLTGELIERLTESVRLRMIADVPLGAFLSGGVDSSAVVATMARISDGPVTTCSISFGDPNFNEASFAKTIAERYRTNHFSEQVEPDDYGLLSTLSGNYDEPFADSSAIPTYRVCQLARRHVTVALSGDGGDENLAGYRRYKWFEFEERFRRVVPSALRAPLFGFLGAVYPKADWAPRVLRAKATLEAIGRNSIDGYFHGVSMSSKSIRASLFSEKFKKSLSGYSAVEVFEWHARNFAGEDSLSLVQYLDFKTYLPGDILTKVDRASMANSLEVRVPLLDHEIVEWFASLSPRLKLRGADGKYIFKKSLESILPNEILYRPKMGFAVPIGKWFRGPLKAAIYSKILGQGVLGTGIFNEASLMKILDLHVSGVRDFSSIIWALLMFSEFVETYLEPC
jgi:asparagine synthase (glutamine-hydrolysing)